METENYNNLLNFIFEQKYPSNFTPPQEKQLENQAKHFSVENNLLYKIDKNNPKNKLRVVRKWELDPVLFMFHNDPTAAHASKEKMMDKMKI